MSLNAPVSGGTPEIGAFQRTVAALWACSPLARRVTHPGAEATVKLAEEVGEVAKEVGRLGHEWPLPEKAATRQALESELGDILFVAARLANIYRLDLGQAAQGALERFAVRYAGIDIEPVTEATQVSGEQVEAAVRAAGFQPFVVPDIYVPRPAMCDLPHFRRGSQTVVIDHFANTATIKVAIGDLPATLRAVEPNASDRCPGGLVECYFHRDEAVPAGAECARCGHRKGATSP